MTKELELCPFCGGHAIKPNERDHHVSCSNCGATGANWAEYDSAIEAWNTRYKRTCKWWLEDYHDEANNVWTTECGERFCYGEYGHPNCCPYCGAEVVDG